MDATGGAGGNAAPWRRQGSQGGGGGTSNPQSPSSPAPQASNNNPSTSPMNSVVGPPPPPPPPMAPGNAIPSVRLNSEIGARDTRGPPKQIASAMMKDKKPFTYTPGGIDLSEIRSPRMAKRIQVNAAAEGVSSVPQQQQQSGGGPPPPGPIYLPPASMAAMNPAMAIPVLPQGGFNPANLHRTQKPSDFVRQDYEDQSQYQPPQHHHPQQSHHPQHPFLQQQLQQQIQQHQQQRQHQLQQQQQQQYQPPTNISQSPRSPPPMAERPVSTGVPIQLMNNVTGRTSSTSPERTSGTGSIYIPPLTPTPSTPSPYSQSNLVGSSNSPSSHQSQQQQPRPTPQTKAQAHSQNLGSIYIPPIEQRPSVFSERNTSTPSTASTSVESPTKTPQTPQLNKINPPWMNSYNRLQGQAQQGVPQSTNVNANTPWGTSLARTIPITIVRDDDQPTTQQQQQQQQPSQQPPWRQQPTDIGYNSGARIVPIQLEAQPVQSGFRDIPIQFEGNMKRGPGTPGGQYHPYNQSPVSHYSPSNSANKDGFARQAAELSAGVDKVSMGDESPRTEPIQSKSFRVIQKITDDDQGDQQRRLELAGDDKRLMDEIRTQVDEGTLHQTSEPRFRGGHIPSRAFRQLQGNLPGSSSSGGQDFTPNYPTQTGPGPVTHNIPIRMVPINSSGSQSQPGEFSSQSQSRVPPSQQQVAEPKKYTGSNIPSRSFKILQQMTADDDAALVGTQSADDDGAEKLQTNKKVTSRPPRPPCRSLSSTPTPQNPANNNQFVRSRTVSPSPTPRAQCTCNCNHTPSNNNNNNNNYSNGSSSSNNNSYYNNNNYYPNQHQQQYGGGSESESEDFTPTQLHHPQPRSYSPWPENYDPNYDPYAYIQWYYWWYYHFCVKDAMQNPEGYQNYDGYPIPWNGAYENPQQQQPPPPQQNYSLNPHQSPGGGHTNYAYTDSEAEQSDSSSYQYLSTEEDESLRNFRRQSPKQKYQTPNPYENYYNNNDQYSEVEGENELTNSSNGAVPKIVIDKSRESPQAQRGSVPVSQDTLESSEKIVMNGVCEDADYKNNRNKEMGEEKEWKEAEEENIPESVENFVRNDDEEEEEIEDNVASDCDSRIEKERIEQKAVPRNEESESDLDLDDIVERVNEMCISEDVDVKENPPTKTSNMISMKNGENDKVIHDLKHEETVPLPNPALSSFVDSNSGDRDRLETFIDCNGETEEEEEISLGGRGGRSKREEGGSTTDNSDVCSLVGVVEEPDTPSSSEDDAPTLVDDSEAIFNRAGVLIEECYSTTTTESDSGSIHDLDSPDVGIENITKTFSTPPMGNPNFVMHRPKKLSTIDELSERSQRTFSYDDNFPEDTLGEEFISDDEEDTTDEGSSVSVIENKSDANNDWGATTAGESHADEASTSSSDAEDENDDDPLLPTVSVSLPLTLSFSKSKSCRDIATFMVGDNQVTEEYRLESELGFRDEDEEKEARKEVEEEVESDVTTAVSLKEEEVEEDYRFVELNNRSYMSCGSDALGVVEEVLTEDEREFSIVENECEYDDEEPVVSYTISLSRSTSKKPEEEEDSDSGEEELEVDGQPEEEVKNSNGEQTEDIDFWGAIQQSEEAKSPFWKEFKNSRSLSYEQDVINDDEDNVEESLTKEEAPTATTTTTDQQQQVKEEEEEADFWAELDTEKSTDYRRKTEEYWPSYRSQTYKLDEQDHWSQQNEDQNKKEQEEEEEADFWREIKSSSTTEDEISCSKNKDQEIDTVNFWDRGRTFVDPKKFNRQFSWEINDVEEDTDQLNETVLSPTQEEEVNSVEQEPIIETVIPEETIVKGNEGGGERKMSETLLNFLKFEEATREESMSDDSGQVKMTSESSKIQIENSNDIRENCSKVKVGESSTTEKVNIDMNVNNGRSVKSETKKSEEKFRFKEIKSERIEEAEVSSQKKETSVKSTSKIDTIFSNRKLDNCDFQASLASHQQSNGTSTSSSKKKFGGGTQSNGSTKSNSKLSRVELDAAAVSDENSDESSSTTVAENKKSEADLISATAREKETRERKSSSPQFELKRTTSLTKKEVNERNVEIKETREKFKLRSQHTDNLDLTSSSTSQENDVVVDLSSQNGERGNRAEELLTKPNLCEDLLWRIERFLQCSLSLGSEDDSGVMTDISRQISDVDTDENENIETVVIRNKSNNSCNTGISNSKSSRSIKTRSMIETYSSTNTSKMESFEETATTNSNGVVMRNMSSEKKSLRYQRAKTHSRLFQLLQTESCKDESSEEEIMEEAIDFENLEQVEAAIEKSQNKKCSVVSSLKDNVTSSTELNHGMEMTDSGKSRLVPLPIKNFLASSMSMDSTSSSSGVLSPSSPSSRDQLLADIINEFHQRHQTKTKKRVSNFPSKIFKLLQSEFGEEFYDAFDCCEDDFGWGDNPITSSSTTSNKLKPSSSSTLVDNGSHCPIKSRHKNKNKQNSFDDESYDDTPPSSTSPSSSSASSSNQNNNICSKKQEQEIMRMMMNGGETMTTITTATTTSVDSNCSSNKKIEFLEVPPRRKKSSLNRDPRVPKNRNKSHTAAAVL